MLRGYSVAEGGFWGVRDGTGSSDGLWLVTEPHMGFHAVSVSNH